MEARCRIRREVHIGGDSLITRLLLASWDLGDEMPNQPIDDRYCLFDSFSYSLDTVRNVLLQLVRQLQYQYHACHSVAHRPPRSTALVWKRRWKIHHMQAAPCRSHNGRNDQSEDLPGLSCQ